MPKQTYEEVRAFLLDGGRTRKASRMEADAPLYVADNSDEADEYFVLTKAGADAAEKYLSLPYKERRSRSRSHGRYIGTEETTPCQ